MPAGALTSLTEEELRIAGEIAAVPHNAEKEGPINWQNADYKGISGCKYFGEPVPVADEEEGPVKCGGLCGSPAKKRGPVPSEAAAKCPHESLKAKPRPTGIAESALEYVGNTPLIKFSRLSKFLGIPEGVELIGKCEGYSVGHKKK